MKNNSNSILNKIGDVNTEILKLNRKLQNVESFNEKLENNIKEETLLRQNIEKKSFHMNETFNNKFASLRKGFDDLVQVITEQVEGIKVKVMEDIQKNNEQFLKGFEDSLKRIENNEKNYKNNFSEFSLFKSENGSKLIQLETILQKEIKEIRKEVTNNNMKLEILEKKLNDNMTSMNKDLSDLSKDINHIKNDIEMIKNFKENTILNFKDISDEFVKNEELFNKFSNKISVQIQEFESKISLFESTFNLQNDSFVSIKKDIYTQIYDTNLNINNKFQMMNESLFDKLEGYDKSIQNFQNSLIDENEKFTTFITDQMEQHHKNIKKLVDYMNEDLDLLKSKSSNLEEIIKNLRSEFFNNLNEVEEFLIKKYETLFRSITINSERR